AIEALSGALTFVDGTARVICNERNIKFAKQHAVREARSGKDVYIRPLLRRAKPDAADNGGVADQECAAIGVYAANRYGGPAQCPSAAEAIALINESCNAAGIQPTLIVDSGDSCFVFVKFVEAVTITSAADRTRVENLERGFVRALSAAATEHGWNDAVVE